jgi:hypothetical protein
MKTVQRGGGRVHEALIHETSTVLYSTKQNPPTQISCKLQPNETRKLYVLYTYLESY